MSSCDAAEVHRLNLVDFNVMSKRLGDLCTEDCETTISHDTGFAQVQHCNQRVLRAHIAYSIVLVLPKWCTKVPDRGGVHPSEHPPFASTLASTTLQDVETRTRCWQSIHLTPYASSGPSLCRASLIQVNILFASFIWLFNL